jgi:hypothetical protein
MFKWSGLCTLILISSFSSIAFAQKTIKLNPNENKTLTNSGFWTLNATCNIQSSKPMRSKIKIMVLKHTGSINGKNLSSGQSTSLKVTNNSSISVSAESGTQINLINVGDQAVEAVCST